MSKNKDLKRARRAAQVLVEPMPTVPTPPLNPPPHAPEPKRAAFTVTVTFDPAKPKQTKYDVISIGDGVAHDGDILDALQLTRDDILINSAAELARQQFQAQLSAQAPAPPLPSDSAAGATVA